jgi:hypothetical protein
MDYADVFMLALCAWRENRSGQTAGMQSVMNCVMNRVAMRKSSAYMEIVRSRQFSSITTKGDPQLGLFPQPSDPQWFEAGNMAVKALAGTLEDITGGATSYYAVSMSQPPYWAVDMERTEVVAGQQFMK